MNSKLLSRNAMTLILSLVRKELIYRPRDKWFHLKRLLYIAIGGIIVLGVYLQQILSQGNKAGLVMFEWLSMLVVISACLVGPYMATSAIIKEKESRTLSLLMMSDISTWQLLVSKLFSAVFTTFFTVISVLPLFILCESLGGIMTRQVILAFPVLLTTVISGSCLGLFIAAFIERELRMQGYVALGALTFYAVIPAAVFLIALALTDPPTAQKVLTVISPGAAMFAIKQDMNLHLVGWNCLFNSLIGLPFIPAAIYLLPRIYVRPGGIAGMVERLRERIGGESYHKLKRDRPQILGNPVTWKDLHIHHGGERNSWVKCLVVGAITAFLVGAIYITLSVVPATGLKFDVLELGQSIVFGVAVLSGVNYIYGAISRAAQCCLREKNNNTLEILLTTDISGYSIIMGKSNAISLTLLPWIVVFICSSITFLFVSILRSGIDLGFVMICAAVVLNLLCMVFAYEYIAMYSSLKLHSYSTATALAGFVAWYIVGNLVLGIAAAIFIPFTFYLSVLAFPIAGPVIIGNHFRLRLIEEFQTIATRGEV